jgi:TetR/AcrR family transcriptional regulator, regulator of cefoperazone and chloramphenicol sensitivity
MVEFPPQPGESDLRASPSPTNGHFSSRTSESANPRLRIPIQSYSMPYMRTAPPPRDEDLTARARIRDAAIERFAADGYQGTSVRDIARAAGVSPGLVQHHFGSKEGLREACDARVLEVLREVTARKLEREEYDADFLSSLIDSSTLIVRYIARGLTEEWPGVASMFDQAAGDSAGWLTQKWPDRFPAGAQETRTHGAVLAAMSLGTIVLHGHVSRWMGVDALARENEHVRSAAAAEVILRMAEFLESASGRSMRSALEEYERRSRMAEGDDG